MIASFEVERRASASSRDIPLEEYVLDCIMCELISIFDGIVVRDAP